MYSFKQMVKGFKAISKLGISAKQMRINLTITNKAKCGQSFGCKCLVCTDRKFSDVPIVNQLMTEQKALVRKLHKQQTTITNQNKMIKLMKKEIEGYKNARNF